MFYFYFFFPSFLFLKVGHLRDCKLSRQVYFVCRTSFHWRNQQKKKHVVEMTERIFFCFRMYRALI